MTRLRRWDAPAAQSRACSSLQGCTDTIVITIANAVHNKMEEVGGCCMLGWLPQVCRCMQPLSAASPAALTSGSTIAGVHRL